MGTRAAVAGPMKTCQGPVWSLTRGSDNPFRHFQAFSLGEPLVIPGSVYPLPDFPRHCGAHSLGVRILAT
jgi:hypothetical protein